METGTESARLLELRRKIQPMIDEMKRKKALAEAEKLSQSQNKVPEKRLPVPETKTPPVISKTVSVEKAEKPKPAATTATTVEKKSVERKPVVKKETLCIQKAPAVTSNYAKKGSSSETPLISPLVSAEDYDKKFSDHIFLRLSKGTRKLVKNFFKSNGVTMTQGIEMAIYYLMKDVDDGIIKINKAGIFKTFEYEDYKGTVEEEIPKKQRKRRK